MVLEFQRQKKVGVVDRHEYKRGRFILSKYEKLWAEVVFKKDKFRFLIKSPSLLHGKHIYMEFMYILYYCIFNYILSFYISVLRNELGPSIIIKRGKHVKRMAEKVQLIEK